LSGAAEKGKGKGKTRSPAPLVAAEAQKEKSTWKGGKNGRPTLPIISGTNRRTLNERGEKKKEKSGQCAKPGK